MHIKLRINSVIVVVVLLFLLASCSKKEEGNYVAKVGNSFLTEAMIEESLNSSDKNKFREEFIREWIERQLIYLDALKVGIANSDEYKNLIDDAKIDVANVLALKKMFLKRHIDVTNIVLEQFYVENISEFEIASPRLVYNLATFNSRDIAVKFRKKLISENWQNSVEFFEAKGINFSVKDNIIEYVYNILPEKFANQIFQCNTKYSEVIQKSKNIFAVVQIIKKYYKNDVLEFDEIKEEIKEKYLSVKREELYNNYLKELYAEYGSEIKR